MNVTENDIIAAYMPHIKHICQGKWLNLEPEDRESEAVFFFMCALRSFSLDSGNFWKDYCEALSPYMDGLNRCAPSHYYKKKYSLDCPILTHNDKSPMTLLDILEGPGLDETTLFVESFMETLVPEDKDILHDLMDKASYAFVARDHHLTAYSLKKRLEKIGMAYIKKQCDF